MAVTSHESLLQVPWIWPDSQHFKVVIGLQNQHMRSTQLMSDIVRHVADVGQLRDLHSAAIDAERDWLGRIMRHFERQNLYVSNFECDTRFYRYYVRTIELKRLRLYRRQGSRRQERVDRQFLQKYVQSAGVIRMLVRDQYGINAVGILTDRLQSHRQLLAAQPGIDQ